METRELEIANFKDCTFKVKPSRKTVFSEISEKTELPHLHLVIVDDTEELSWPDMHKCNVTNGQLIDATESKMHEVVKFYFGEDTDVGDFAWRYVHNSERAISWEFVHIHLYIAHKDLFGEDGLIMRTVDSVLKDGA